MANPIKLPDEAASRALASVKRYAAEELDLTLGDLKAQLLLEFIVRELGPSIYNLALEDAQRWLTERAGDLDGALGKAEFTYWPSSVRRKG